MPRRPPFLLALIIIALAAAIGGGVQEWRTRPVAAPPPPQIGAAIVGRARVVDGDTLDVAGHRVRLFGIDAPESRQTCRDDPADVFAAGIYDVECHRCAKIHHHRRCAEKTSGGDGIRQSIRADASRARIVQSDQTQCLRGEFQTSQPP